MRSAAVSRAADVIVETRGRKVWGPALAPDVEYKAHTYMLCRTYYICSSSSNAVLLLHSMYYVDEW